MKKIKINFQLRFTSNKDEDERLKIMGDRDPHISLHEVSLIVVDVDTKIQKPGKIKGRSVDEQMTFFWERGTLLTRQYHDDQQVIDLGSELVQSRLLRDSVWIMGDRDPQGLMILMYSYITKLMAPTSRGRANFFFAA